MRDSFLQFFHKKRSSLFGNILFGSLLSTSSRLLVSIFNIISLFIMAKFYGAEIIGDLAFLTSTIWLVSFPYSNSINMSLSKFLPEHLARHSGKSVRLLILQTRRYVFILTGSAAILLFLLSSPLAKYIFRKPQLQPVLIFAAVSLVFQCWGFHSIGVTRALSRYKSYAIMLVLPFFLFTLFLSATIPMNKNALSPLYANTLALIIAAVIQHFMTTHEFRKINDQRTEIGEVSTGEFLSLSFSMFFIALYISHLPHLETILFSAFRSQKELGVFSLILKITHISSFLYLSFNTFLLPKFSDLFHSRRYEELAALARRSSKFLFLVFSLFGVCMLVAGRFVLRLFGPEFTPGFIPLMLLILSQVLYALTGFGSLLLSVSPHFKKIRNISISFLILHLLMNFFIIPRWGMIGVAVVRIVCLTGNNLWFALLVRRRFGFTVDFLPIRRKSKRDSATPDFLQKFPL